MSEKIGLIVKAGPQKGTRELIRRDNGSPGKNTSDYIKRENGTKLFGDRDGI